MLQIRTMLTYEDFKEMFNLELTFYDACYITPSEEAYSWYKKNPTSTVCVEDNGKIVGFCNLFPIQEQVYRQLKKGLMNDAELREVDMLALNEYQGNLYLFFSCIVVLPIPEKKEVIQMLLRWYKAFYSDLDMCNIVEVVLDAVTPGGESFARSMGMNLLKKSDHESHIFTGKWDQIIDNIH